MRQVMKSKLIKVFALILSVCMLIGTMGMISSFVARAESTTSVATLVPGASVRVTDAEKSGIKFKARLSKSEYNTLYNEYDGENGNVKAGMIIVPSDYIAKADGYTFAAFDAAGLTVGSQVTEEFAEAVIDETAYLEFTMSLVNLKDNNYARDFEAIVFIQFSGASAPANAEASGDSKYLYAERNAENARNIYEVAYKTFNDRADAQDEAHPFEVEGKFMSVDENGLPIVKGYVDGVADVKFVGGTVVAANNSTYYTSPYTVTKDAITGDFLLNGAPKSLVYNGERKADMHVEDGKNMAELHVIKSKGATVESGVITTTGRELGSSGQPFTLIPGAKLSSGTVVGSENAYYAFDGKYGVGTAIDIYFTGNNMPEVMFFANTISGNMTGYSSWNGANGTAGVPSGEKGLLIANGFYSTTNTADAHFTIWGPNKLFLGETAALNGTINSAQGKALTYGTSGGTMKHFVQSYIASTYADVNFKYTITTYESDGKLGVKGQLYNVDTEALVHSYDYKFDILSEIQPGAIVLYDTVKGASNNTVFTCSAPYGGETVSNGFVAPDGTVTLTTAKAASAGGTFGISALNNAYVALEGEYGIGTFVDVEFKGHNMPQIMFFADQINGNMSSNGGAGLIVMNGLNAGSVAGANEINYFGPNRFGASNNFITLTDQTSAKYELTTSSAFTYTALSADTSDRTYIYRIGTMLDEADNTIILHAEFFDKATGGVIETATADTGILATEVNAGSIIAYAPVKGAGTATFKIGKPYAGSATVNMRGATIANDGTVTLAGRGLNGSGQPFALVTNNANYTNDTPLSYLGLIGEYGVGTYMDFYFTGNNMPEVMFFADVINDELTGYGNWVSPNSTVNGRKGVLVSNGIYSSITANDINHAFTVWGPDRIFFGEGKSLAGAFTGFLKYANVSITDGSLLTQETLGNGNYDTTNFKYTVGTYGLNGKLGVHVILYTVSGGVETKVIEHTLYTGIALTEIKADNIVIYDSIKGKGTTTVFKYSTPYISAPSVFSQGATVAEDGTVTLTGTTAGNRMYDLAKLNNNYYALYGNYGVGTTVETYFTGNNMPEIMLFADAISGNMTAYDDYTYNSDSVWTNYTLSGAKGLLFSNGFAGGANNNGAPDKYAIWGMDKVFSKDSSLGNGLRDAMTGALKVYAKDTAEAAALSQLSLDSTYAETALKYVVGTYDNNGKLAVTVTLTNVATSEEIVSIDFTTTVDTASVKPGSIIFYDTVKGTGNNTIFKIGEIGK